MTGTPVSVLPPPLLVSAVVQTAAMLVAVLLQTLLEAFTCQIDNLVLPVYGVILYNLAYRVGQMSPAQRFRRP